MFRALVLFTLTFAVASAAAEELVLKDGTKIVGKLTAISGDKIEVETAYGKMQINRSDILTISFPENGSPASSSAAPDKKALPVIAESLQGTQYDNQTGNFSLVLPSEWKINPAVRLAADVLAGLSSGDNTRYLIVIDEAYPGSPDSYKVLVEAQARGKLHDYEKLIETPTTIDGKSSILLSYRGISSAAQNLPIQFLVAIVPSAKGYFRITTWCVEPLFNESQTTFENIIRSFHSSSQPSSTTPTKKQ